MSERVGRLFIKDHTDAIICHWSIQGHQLNLKSTATDLSNWHLDLNQALLTLGGFNQEQIILKSDRLTFYAERSQLEKPLQDLGLLQLQQHLKHEKTRVRHQTYFSYLLLSLIITLILTGIGCFWWFSNRMVTAATAMTPITWDVQLGQSIPLTSFGPTINDPEIAAPIEQMVKELSLPYRDQGFVFEVQVIDRADVNALALPGGKIAVFTGLLQAADTADEVAGVLAHEIQHVVLRHSLQKIYGQLRWQLALSVLTGNSQGLHSQLMSSGALLANLSYDRSMESQADHQGFLLLGKVGYPQAGMINFFKKLAQDQSFVEKKLQYISTHPASENRIVALNNLLDKSATGHLKVDWQQLKTALGKRGKGDMSNEY